MAILRLSLSGAEGHTGTDGWPDLSAHELAASRLGLPVGGRELR
jgi:hypothetical protein